MFAGGGTGGHLFPALAVIEHLRELSAPVDAEFLCTARPLDTRTLSAWNVRHACQPVQPLQFRPSRLARFYLCWRRSLQQCRDKFRERRPAVVVGTGGFGSGPAVVAASRLAIPCALLNPDVLPGRANRFLARRARDIFAQWPATRPHLQGHQGVHVWGCPVRAAFQRAAPAPHAHFQLDLGRRTLLVTGASLGSRSINEAMVQLAAELTCMADWQVLHISGEQDQDAVRRAYAEAGVRASVCPFTSDMAAALACCDLVVGRAGAVTLAELSAVGRAAVLVPYPHADHHQRANGQVLVDLGAAVMIKDAQEPRANARGLRDALFPLLADPLRRAAMADAARAAAPCDAAARVAGRLLEIAGIRTARSTDSIQSSAASGR